MFHPGSSTRLVGVRFGFFLFSSSSPRRTPPSGKFLSQQHATAIPTPCVFLCGFLISYLCISSLLRTCPRGCHRDRRRWSKYCDDWHEWMNRDALVTYQASFSGRSSVCRSCSLERSSRDISRRPRIYLAIASSLETPDHHPDLISHQDIRFRPLLLFWRSDRQILSRQNYLLHLSFDLGVFWSWEIRERPTTSSVHASQLTAYLTLIHPSFATFTEAP